MRRTTKYVALDVHQATTVASVREASGRVIARSVLPTETSLVAYQEGVARAAPRAGPACRLHARVSRHGAQTSHPLTSPRQSPVRWI
jgi:hypothetical protein